MTQPQEEQPNFQRVAVNLQQRFAERIANYEGEIALMQDKYETRLEELQAEVDRLTNENENLSKKK